MFVIYNFLFLIIVFIYLPIYLLKGKFHRGFLLRLGILPKDLNLDRPIWIHAVSVGEAMALRLFLEELRRLYPNKKIVISTVTATGNKIARDMVREGDYLTYLPLDFSFIVRSVIKRINPVFFIIAETEIWPNLISTLYKKNIPVVIVNGRISDNSFKGYLRIKFLLKPLLNKVDLFCVQGQRDAQRLIKLGAKTEKIKVTGNMKFDTMLACPAGRDYTDYKNKLGIKTGEKLFIAASTHPGEEEIILTAYKKLLNEYGNLRLLIAPRHPERSAQVKKLIFRFGFAPVLISDLSLKPAVCSLQSVFILDTIGQLISFYAISDIVFVGGSFIKKGGHNILEPALQGKPVLFGPYMFNFRDISELFLRNQAAILVQNQQDLKEKIGYLLSHPLDRDRLIKRAEGLILENQGATQKNLGYIKEIKSL